MGKPLLSKLDLGIDVLWQGDFAFGLAGAAGGIALALRWPGSLTAAAPVALGVVGVVIGAVVAGIAVLAAFMDTMFLRKLHRIGKRAERYVSPPLFTGALGVIASISLLVVVALPATAPRWLLATSAGISGLFAVWTLASVWKILGGLLDFVGLRGDAADVPDEVLQDGGVVHRLPQEPNRDAGR